MSEKSEEKDEKRYQYEYVIHRVLHSLIPLGALGFPDEDNEGRFRQNLERLTDTLASIMDDEGHHELPRPGRSAFHRYYSP